MLRFTSFMTHYAKTSTSFYFNAKWKIYHFSCDRLMDFNVTFLLSLFISHLFIEFKTKLIFHWFSHFCSWTFTTGVPFNAIFRIDSIAENWILLRFDSVAASLLSVLCLTEKINVLSGINSVYECSTKEIKSYLAHEMQRQHGKRFVKQANT